MKKKVCENPRVVVEPTVWIDDSFERLIRTCKSIESEIKRHVDDIEHVSIEYDTREICEFCETEWETNFEGMPQCCVTAIDEWEDKKATQPQK